MEPVRRDITIVRGDLYEHIVEFVDRAYAPVDLTGLTFTAMLRTSPDAASSVSFVIDNSQVAVGQVGMSLAAVTTGAFTETEYVYDLQSSVPETVMMGRISVIFDVTHA